jgi:hypothetical protein
MAMDAGTVLLLEGAGGLLSSQLLERNRRMEHGIALLLWMRHYVAGVVGMHAIVERGLKRQALMRWKGEWRRRAHVGHLRGSGVVLTMWALGLDRWRHDLVEWGPWWGHLSASGPATALLEECQQRICLRLLAGGLYERRLHAHAHAEQPFKFSSWV